MTTSVRTGRFSPQRRFDYRRLVTVFDSYVQTGRVDLAVRGRGGGGPRPEGSDFVALDAAWGAEMGRRGLAPATREAYGRVARGYLVFLEARGIAVLDGAGGASVLAFWNPYWIGGPSRRCFGWCRTFVHSSSSPAAPIWSMR